MPCRSGKVPHATRDAALAAMKHVVWINHSRGEDERSVGLNVYPCDDCGAWHFGHLPQTPSCYHYDLFASLDDVVAADALVPPKPVRLPQRAKRQSTGRLLALLVEMEEVSAMTWFSWSGDLDFSRAPHPGAFLNNPPAEHRGEGVLRIAVPAFVAKLRWSDYVQRNKVTRRRCAYFATKGNPAQWLATDAAVPRAAFRSIDVWHRGAWVSIAEVDPDDFERYLAEGESRRR